MLASFGQNFCHKKRVDINIVDTYVVQFASLAISIMYRNLQMLVSIVTIP